MPQVLVFGINRKVHSTFRVMEELGNKKIPHTFIKWGSLSFFDGKLFSNEKEINLNNYRSAFFDIPSYYLTVGKNKVKRLPFDLDNELIEVFKKIKQKKILAMNRDFLLKYPFYNKFTQAEIFSKEKIPSIATLHLTDNKPEKVFQLLNCHGLDFPLVVKESNGGLGEQVWKIKNDVELKKFIKNKRNTSLIYQPLIENDSDYRVLIIGGKSAGIMKRSAQNGEWKNNFALGGKITPHKERGMELFAEEVCQKMEMEYAGVDIFKTTQGYKVIEVNSFARFEGFEKANPRKNIGRMIVNYITQKK